MTIKKYDEDFVYDTRGFYIARRFLTIKRALQSLEQSNIGFNKEYDQTSEELYIQSLIISELSDIEKILINIQPLPEFPGTYSRILTLEEYKEGLYEWADDNDKVLYNSLREEELLIDKKTNRYHAGFLGYDINEIKYIEDVDSRLFLREIIQNM